MQYGSTTKLFEKQLLTTDEPENIDRSQPGDGIRLGRVKLILKLLKIHILLVNKLC